MSSLNSEGIAEFIRIVEEMSELTEGMKDYDRKFIEDNLSRIEAYGDKVKVSEAQLDYARRIYQRTL
jgi:hypothetical protein